MSTIKVNTIEASTGSLVTIGPSQIELAAGTTVTAPLEFTSGSFLTSSTAGAVEYNGQIFTTTPSALKRGLSPSRMLRYNINTVTITNTATTLQDWLGTVDVTVAASTAYSFKGFFRMSRAAGAVSHTVNLGFGGTATLTAINYFVSATTTTGDVLGTPQNLFIATAASTAVTAASTSTTENNVVFMEGTVQINNAGTFIPQVAFSAAPGGAGTIAVGAYFEITPIGINDATINIGDWA